jgi:ubiquinone biosynthesis protein
MATQRSTVDQVRETLRLQQVYNVFMRYGMDLLFDRTILGDFRRSMQRWVYDIPHPLDALSVPVKIRLMLQELGPTYVKMGQIVSSRADVLPPDWAEEMDKLQSDVPPFPYEDVVEILQDELKDRPEEIFATFEVEPFAAASTAQVHKATLHTGEEVVVKVQRPHIKTQVKADVGIMTNASRALERRALWARENDLSGVLEEFGANILQELDYTSEAWNARQISRNMASIPTVRIPEVYGDYTTTRVLTMEFVRGVKVNNVEALSEAGLDRDALAEAVMRSLVKQLLIDGFFHADPHPGNVLINLDTGMIYYIDLGMVGELDFMQRVNLIQLLMVVQQHDSRGLAQVMLSLSKPFKKVDERNYYRTFDRRVGRYLEPGSGGGFGQAVNAALGTLTDNGMRLDPELTLALKSLMQLEAITSALLPDKSATEMANKHIRELAAQEITTERIKQAVVKEATGTARELARRMPSLQEATLGWLDQYQKGRFTLEVDTSDLSKELGRVRGMARFGVLALLLAGMLIGSAFASSFSALGGDFGNLMSRVAFGGYLFSMLIAAIMVVYLLLKIIGGGDEDEEF